MWGRRVVAPLVALVALVSAAPAATAAPPAPGPVAFLDTQAGRLFGTSRDPVRRDPCQEVTWRFANPTLPGDVEYARWATEYVSRLSGVPFRQVPAGQPATLTFEYRNFASTPSLAKVYSSAVTYVPAVADPGYTWKRLDKGWIYINDVYVREYWNYGWLYSGGLRINDPETRKRLFAHELGHFMGLAHVDGARNPSALMAETSVVNTLRFNWAEAVSLRMLGAAGGCLAPVPAPVSSVRPAAASQQTVSVSWVTPAGHVGWQYAQLCAGSSCVPGTRTAGAVRGESTWRFANAVCGKRYTLKVTSGNRDRSRTDQTTFTSRCLPR